MSKDNNCIFCKIIDKQISANIVYETNNLMAFHDANPVARLHLLIIPKTHVASINDLDEAHAHVIADMILLAKQLARTFGVNESGYRLVMNTGKQAGQSVFHLHVHLLGGRDFSWPPG
jgi:histidine triad (HIT) family protein